MTIRNENEDFKQFIGGYFHQDCDADSPDEVVQDFMRNEPSAYVVGVVKAIDKILSRNLSKENLYVFLREAGLELTEAAIGGDSKAWLIHIRKMMIDHLLTKE